MDGWMDWLCLVDCWSILPSFLPSHLPPFLLLTSPSLFVSSWSSLSLTDVPLCPSQVGSERFRRLNDALFYSSFGMFGGGGGGAVGGVTWLVTNAIPLAYLFITTQAKNLSNNISKELEAQAAPPAAS